MTNIICGSVKMYPRPSWDEKEEFVRYLDTQVIRSKVIITYFFFLGSYSLFYFIVSRLKSLRCFLVYFGVSFYSLVYTF